MKARDFLTFSATLAGMSQEAAWRSAVSRAYYAAFHAARELFAALGFSVPQGDRAHGYLWLRLQNSGDSGVEDAGRGLQSLRTNRNIADYELHRPVNRSVAQKAVQAAETVILALENAVQEPTRTAITDAMKIYERNVLKDVTWHP